MAGALLTAGGTFLRAHGSVLMQRATAVLSASDEAMGLYRAGQPGLARLAHASRALDLAARGASLENSAMFAKNFGAALLVGAAFVGGYALGVGMNCLGDPNTYQGM